MTRDRARAPLWTKLLGLAVLGTIVGGCGVLTSPGPAPSASGAVGSEDEVGAASPPEVFYTSAPGVKLYAEPGFGSAELGTLSLHQKVLRTKQERGFAFVAVAETGQEGWLDNAKLVWQRPDADDAPPPVAAEPGSAAPEARAGSPASAGDVNAATPPVGPPDDDRARPAVFNPF